MQSIIQNLVFGLFVGSIYGVGAVGLALIFGVLKILNVAHGELVMIAAYVSFFLFLGLGLDPFLTLLLVVPLLFILGIIFHALLFQRVTRMEPETKIKNSLLISFGLGLVLQNIATLLWTGDERSIQTVYAGLGFQIAGVAFPFTRLATFAIALIAIFFLWFFLQRTRWGRAIRATAEDWEAATQAGIDVRRTYLFTFGLGAGGAGIAGVLLALTYGFTPTIGLAWTLKALIIVVLAGTGSIFGAFPAGLLLGLAEALSGIFNFAEYREVVGLVLFLAVLLLRPQGLFGKT
ncbi:MAG: branched-chain amino acid ABC transporter permease [Chloroflexi bacterium]|nr:branched-chain amino acid ABC transporter permease [Chloroflexota bacterium]